MLEASGRVAKTFVEVSTMLTVSDPAPHASPSGQAKPSKAAEFRQRIDASIDALAKAVDDVRASEMFRDFLAIQARFHRYSWRNSLLILMQHPSASNVAGFQTWKRMGRYVRKGERGITILAPCPWKREVERAGTTAEESGIFFRAVSVFDVSQTDGEALPSVEVPTVDAAADALLANLIRVAEARKIAVEFAPIASGAFGVSRNGSIGIDNAHPTGQQAKTLAHELAHEALHWADKERGTFTRTLAELEAESVAYVVCTHFGLDTEVRSSRYIALWNGDSKSMKESIERIATTARGIIEAVEGNTEAVESESVECARECAA